MPTPRLKPCPFCKKTPELDFDHCGETYSRKDRRFGLVFRSWTKTCCLEAYKAGLYGGGKRIVWANFNRERPYSDKDMEEADRRADEMAIRSWNRKVAAWNRRAGDQPKRTLG